MLFYEKSSTEFYRRSEIILSNIYLKIRDLKAQNTLKKGEME